MAKPSQSEQFDRVVQTILSRSDGSLTGVSARLAPEARAAFALRGLPREEFRSRLKADLERRAEMTATGVKPVREGFHTITPYVIVPGAAGLIEFMKEGLGATEVFRVQRPGTTQITHAEVRIGDSMIEMADSSDQFPPTPGTIHLYVKEADAVYAQALRAGAESLRAPVDQPYGDHEGSVKDTFGNHWYIATHLGPTHIPEGLRTVTPYLHARGADRLLEFVKNAFGAEEVERDLSPQGTIVHAKLRIGDSIVEMGEAHAEFGPMPATLHLYVPDTDALYARAMQAGATSLMPPADQPYGDRGAGVQDAFGNRWFIATHIKDVAF